jgi:hypothetical protein
LRLAGFDLDYFSAVVVTTICTYTVWDVFFTTIRAGDQMTRLERMMRPAAIAAALGYFSLRKRWHTITPLALNTEPANRAGWNIIAGSS